MIQITCKGNSASCTRTERLTSGMVGLQCEFIFDEAWDGLAKTAVFLAGNEQRDVLLTGALCTVPWEVLQHPGYQLVIGVYGSNADGTMTIPTVYTMCGSIAPGADPSGEESTDPTLPVWGQLQGMIGNLNDLQTDSKDTLVDAINEAAQSGGGGGGTSSGGMSVAAKNLLLTILRAGFYSSDQTSNIAALDVVLASGGSTGDGDSSGGGSGSGSGGDTGGSGGDEPTNTILAIEDGVYAVERNKVLCIIPGGDADVEAAGDVLTIGGGVLVHKQTNTLTVY